MAHPQSGYSSTVSRSNWNLEMSVLWNGGGGGGTGVRGGKPIGARTRTNSDEQTQPTKRSIKGSIPRI